MLYTFLNGSFASGSHFCQTQRARSRENNIGLNYHADVLKFIVEDGLRASTGWPGLPYAHTHTHTHMYLQNHIHSAVRGETKAHELKLRCQPITTAELT